MRQARKSSVMAKVFAPTAHLAQQMSNGLLSLAQTAERTAQELAQALGDAALLVQQTLAQGGTLFFCGNGGSAADSQHIAAEYVVRFGKDRGALPAIALTTDTSILTACANDYGFARVFSRQIEALVKPIDLVIIHSTSGDSENVLLAAQAARAKGAKTMALLAKGGGKLKDLVDLALVIPTNRTDRAQEMHIAVQHLICELAEAAD